MKNIHELTVVQTYYFKQDELPYSYLNTKAFVSSLEDAFEFQSKNPLIVQNGVGPGFDFFNGSLKKAAQLIPIKQFRYEPTKLSLVIVGNSQVARSIFDEVVSKIRAIVPTFVPNVIEIGQQANCVVDLDFDYRLLFNPHVIKFLEDNTKVIASSKGNDAVVEPRIFRAAVKVSNKIYTENNIGTETVISIEPRIGTSLSQQRYFISAPVDSTTLIRLIEEFEKLFKSKESN